MKAIAQASENITQRLTWSTALRDQPGVSKDLASGVDIPEVYGLGDAGLFDLFFGFLEEFDLMKHLQALDPRGKQRNSNVAFAAVILIYLMRVVAGLKFFWHIEMVILYSPSLMRLVGFNGRQVQKGTCARGTHHNKAQAEDDPTEIRGPICADSIASQIQKIFASALERCLNCIIATLAAHSFFPKKVRTILDASEIQTTEKCEGCGKVTKEKAPELRRRRKRVSKVLETVFGFKIWVVWDPNSKLPLAMRFAPINVADVTMAQEVIQQARTNLGSHASIVSIDLDRGFMDGKLLHWLNSQGITFFIPAKSSMGVYKEALALVDTGIHKICDRVRSVGSGKNKTTVTDHYDVVGIESLTTAGFYGELGSGSHENRKDFVANPINAAVVLDSPYKRKHPDAQPMVILTNGSVQKPMAVYDAYDERSEIENSVFREAKQTWFIQRAARNNIHAYRAHVYITIMAMALTTAFRTWKEKEEAAGAKGRENGMRKFRQQVQLESGGKAIVFFGERYGIFEFYEILILSGRNVLMPRGVPETITKEDILLKYGALLE